MRQLRYQLLRLFILQKFTVGFQEGLVLSQFDYHLKVLVDLFRGRTSRQLGRKRITLDGLARDCLIGASNRFAKRIPTEQRHDGSQQQWAQQAKQHHRTPRPHHFSLTQCEQHALDTVKSLCRLGGDASIDDVSQRSIDTRDVPMLGGQGRVENRFAVFSQPLNDIHRRLNLVRQTGRLIGWLPRQHTKQKCAQTVHIPFRIRQRLKIGLFRSHVVQRPKCWSLLGTESRLPEVRHSGLAVLVEQNIAGFQITVQDSFSVQVHHSRGDFGKQFDRFRHRHSLSAAQTLLKGSVLDQVHHIIRRIGVPTNIQ